jgi:hypothetical protein
MKNPTDMGPMGWERVAFGMDSVQRTNEYSKRKSLRFGRRFGRQGTTSPSRTLLSVWSALQSNQCAVWRPHSEGRAA